MSATTGTGRGRARGEGVLRGSTCLGIYGLANGGGRCPARPPQLPQAINPPSCNVLLVVRVRPLSITGNVCVALRCPLFMPHVHSASLLNTLSPPVTFRYRAVLSNPMRSLFPRLGHYQPVSTFAEQADAGLSSSLFDIEANIRDGDSRAGLDERGTQEVLDIMRRERVK